MFFFDFSENHEMRTQVVELRLLQFLDICNQFWLNHLNLHCLDPWFGWNNPNFLWCNLWNLQYCKWNLQNCVLNPNFWSLNRHVWWLNPRLMPVSVCKIRRSAFGVPRISAISKVDQRGYRRCCSLLAGRMPSISRTLASCAGQKDITQWGNKQILRMCNTKYVINK